MPRTRPAPSSIAIGVLLSGTLLGAGPSTAGILDATWTAPTTNTDGSPLTDLAFYRLYYGPSTSPCPGSASVQVAAPAPTPGPNQTMSYRLTGLTTGTLYNVAVTAVDSVGMQSACSSVASAVARADFAVSPTGTVNFGSVTIGSFADQVFTVSNTGGGTVSGAASTAAPFSIVSGSPFTLGGAGANQTVTVRFTPTTVATTSATVSFTANGGSSSAIATGSGTALANTPPPIAVAAPPASATVSGPAEVPLTVANASAGVVAGPVISQVTLSARSSGVRIGWITNVASDTQVEYGLTTSYGRVTPLNGSFVTSHSQAIRRLAPNTWYNFRMRSRDAAGNLAVSENYRFRTRSGD